MLKNYELLYIVHPDLEGTTDKVMEKIAGFVTKTDGKIISQEDWGKRKLAYKIAKNDFGVYVLVQFSTESTKLREIERGLRLSEEIMRSMIITLPEEKEVKKQTKKATKPQTAEKEKITQIVVEEKTEIESSDDSVGPMTLTVVSDSSESQPTESVGKEKPVAKKAVKKEAIKAKSSEETVIAPADSVEKKPGVIKDRIEIAKKAVKKTEKPKKEAKAEDEKSRLKKLDEKLEELLK
jgi:small subunit ribosomal protein S6